jgi:8-oxo-dGTP diphosphatase
MPAERPSIQRHAVRALLLCEPDDRLLLMQIHLPDQDRHLWLTPGGGMEPGESPVASLIREVREETGFKVSNPVGPVWTRRHVFGFRGATYDQRESFYLVRTPLLEPDPTQNPAAIEQALFREFRWWSLAEMERSDELFVPRQLASHLQSLLADGLPEVPVEVGR